MLRLRTKRQADAFAKLLPPGVPPLLRRRLNKRDTAPDWEAHLAFQLAHAEPPLLPHVRNYRFAKALGRKFEADFAFLREHYGTGLLVELQGGLWLGGKSGHTSGRGVSRDIAKAQCAVMLGYVLLPITPQDVKSGRAVEMIQHLLGRREAGDAGGAR